MARPGGGSLGRGGVDRVVVHLHAMPQPKDFGLDAKTPPDSPGADRYARALEVWERAVRDISKRIGKKKG